MQATSLKKNEAKDCKMLPGYCDNQTTIEQEVILLDSVQAVNLVGKAQVGPGPAGGPTVGPSPLPMYTAVA